RGGAGRPARAGRRRSLAPPMSGPPARRPFRRRHFVLVLCGPLANALLLAAALWWRPAGESFAGLWTGTQRLLPWHAFALANAALLLFALWPHRYRSARGPNDSDGRQLLSIPFWPEEVVRKSHAVYFLLEAEECIR